MRSSSVWFPARAHDGQDTSSARWRARPLRHGVSTRGGFQGDITFDALTRRTSLAALGTSGLAALLGPLGTDVKKNKSKKANKKAKKKCQAQVGRCLTFFDVDCEGDPDCLADAQLCCPITSSCDIVAFFTCIINAGL